MIVAKIVVRLGKVIGILYATVSPVSRGSSGQEADVGGMRAWGNAGPQSAGSGRAISGNVGLGGAVGGSKAVRGGLGAVKVSGNGAGSMGPG